MQLKRLLPLCCVGLGGLCFWKAALVGQVGVSSMIKHQLLLRLGAAMFVLLSIACSQQTEAEPQSVENSAAMHAALGLKASEGSPGHANLCNMEMVFRNVNRLKTDPPSERAQASSNNRTGSTSRDRQRAAPVAPMQVFDNLYFVGGAGVSAWLLGTEDAYILIDAMNTDDDAKNTIEKGILELGLDPTRIEYLLITHAHGDHYGGYKYFKNTYAPRIVMSATDWQLASMLQEHPRFGVPPEKDYSVVDGDKLTAGDTTIDIYVTPGHTMGTISPVFTVYDNGVPYKAAMWGGTGFNFGPNFDQMSAYAASAQRMKRVAVEENIQVFLANHPRRDGSLERMARLKERSAGDLHAFVDQQLVFAAFETLAQCATAQAYRIAAGDL